GEYYLSDTPIKNNQADTANTTLLGTGLFHEHARNRLAAKVLNVSHRGVWRLLQNEIKWGLGWQLENIDDRLREWELRDSAGYSLPYSDRQILLANNLLSEVQMNSHRFTGYLQDTWKTRIKGGLFTINGGLRLNYWTFNRELLISPRVSMGFLPAWEKDFSFRLSGGLYYQAPFYKELRDTVTVNGLSQVVLNRSIKAQRSWQAVLGMDYHFVAWDRPFKLTTEVYYKDLKNLIPYTVDNVRIRYYGENLAYGHTAGLDFKLFGEFVPGTDSWISLSLMDSKETIGNYTVARPNEQRYNISLYFRDYLPRNPSYSMSLKLVWADGLSFGPPSMDRSYATLRMSPYRRVDIGFSRILAREKEAFMKKGFLRHFENIWIGLDCFNLFGINNTNSYYWITDVAGQEWAIPNYLTGRQLNVSLSMDF
ncbi:MAG: TonB-dependent receptor plug domain-containing protein, partial [Bacteroidales bacterium]